MTPRSPAPIVAIVLLLLPVLYMGSYLALVEPPSHFRGGSHRMRMYGKQYHYRCFNATSQQVFWPLQRIDEQLRPRSDWADRL